MIKLNCKEKRAPGGFDMITVKCELNDNRLYSVADKEFLNANMEKVENGKYVGNEDTYNSSFFAIRSLLKNSSFIKAINSFTRDCDNGDGEEDLMEYYQYLVSSGRI